MSGDLRQRAVGAQIAVGADRKHVGTAGDIALHAELRAEAIDVVDEAGFDRGDQRRMRVEHEIPRDLALQPAPGGKGRQDQLDRCGGIADAVIEPCHLIRFVHRRNRHHRHQDVLVPDLGGIAREQRIDRIRLRTGHHDIDPVAGDIDARQAIDDFVDLRHDDAAAERRGLGDGRRVLGVRTGVQIAVAIGLVGHDERNLRRQIHQHPRVKLEIGMDRADPQRLGGDELGKAAALRAGKGEVQAVGDAALEHREMIGKRQHRLHHVQIMHPRRVHPGEARGQEVGLFLVVALECHPVAGCDNRLQQLDRAVGRADLSVCAADSSRAHEARRAIGSWCRLRHDGLSLLDHLKRR
ncbi:hypothetical protein ACVIHF_005849 [Bradyrhizobium sp. USDA 4506]